MAGSPRRHDGGVPVPPFEDGHRRFGGALSHTGYVRYDIPTTSSLLDLTGQKGVMILESIDGQPEAPRRLSRERIVEAALTFMDEHGAQALTMRKLGAELGVEAMAIYRYVPGREDLLEAVVAHILDGLHERLDEHLTRTWQGYLQAYAHEIRYIAIEHPAVFPLVATKHPAAPWLRPPLRSIELVEEFLTTLSGHGFADEKVVETYRSFTSFLLGYLLLECGMRGADTGPVEEPLDEGGADIPNRDGSSGLTNAPTVRRLRSLLSEDHAEDEFEMAVEALLDRIEMSISQ
ncbi:MAG: TetR/AcrR family transcriptional regulator [Ornithinimicrobium sp.]